MLEIKVYNSTFLIERGDQYTFYNFDLSTVNQNEIDVFLADMDDKAEAKDLGVFVAEKYIRSHNDLEYIVYCNKDAEDIIKKRLEVSTNPIELQGIFVGDVKVTFKDFTAMSPQKEYIVQFFGDINKSREIRMEFADEYSPSAVYPEESLHDMYFTKNAVAIIVLAIALLISIYQVMSRKKEFAVIVVLGESRSSRILRNVLLDGVVMIAILGFIIAMYRIIFGDQINIMYYLVIALVFVVVSVVPELFLYFVNVKKSMIKSVSSSGFRVVNYIMKSFVLIITVTILSSNLFFVFQGINVLSQESEWKELQGYKNYYMPIQDVDGDELRSAFPKLDDDFDFEKNKLSLQTIMEAKISFEFFKENRKDAYIFEAQVLGNMPITYIVNRNAFDLVAEDNPELIELAKDKNVTVLYPENEKKPDTEDIEKIQKEDVLKYSQDIRLFNYDRGSRLIHENKYLDNPVIYLIDDKATEFDTTEYSIKSVKNANEGRYVINKQKYYSIDRILSESSYSINYNMNNRSDNFKAFVNRPDLFIDQAHILEDDIYELYLADKNIYTNILYINTVIAILLLLFDLFLLQVILNMEFQSNATEIIIKKVIGYSKYQRYKGIYIISAIASMASLVALIVIIALFKEEYVFYIIFGFSFLMIIDQIVFLLLVKKYEVKNIPVVLKGGLI